MQFGSNFLPLWMIIFNFLECLLDTLWDNIDKELIIYPHVISSPLWDTWKIPFPSLDHQFICIFYLKSSSWHHIFISFATFLDDEKCCRNCVDYGLKRAKTAKIVSAGQKWTRLGKEYLHSECTSDTNVLIAGGKGGYISACKRDFWFLTKLKLLKNG